MSPSSLPFILLSVCIIVMMSCCSSSVLAADADSNITSTMKSVRENVMAKSVIEPTSVLSSQVSTDDSKPICKPTTPIAISNKTLSVYGTIDLTNSTATLEPSMILPGSKYTTRPSNSSFTITLLNSEGKTLARYPFSPKAYTYFPQNKDKMALLSEAVPYISCTKQIMITKDGNQMASRYVSAHSPEVKVIFPTGGGILRDKFTVRWQASDPDGDRLTYSLLYSTDNGLTWQTVVKNINESEIIIDPAELPGSTKALFRVIATDGINTAIDDSDDTFNVPTRASH